MEAIATTATDHQGTTIEMATVEVTAVTESIEEIVAATMVTAMGTEAVVGAETTDGTGTGIVVVVAGTMTIIRDITKTIGAVTIERLAKTTPDSMAGGEAVGKMEAFPMVIVVDEAEDRNKMV